MTRRIVPWTGCIAVMLLAISFLDGCSLLCPTKVSRYVVEPAAREPAPAGLLSGSVFLEPVEAADEYQDEYVVFIADDTRRIVSADDKAWQSPAPVMVERALSRALSERYPGQLRASMFPPPEYVIHVNLEKAAITGDRACDWKDAACDMRIEIRRLRNGAYVTVSSRRYSKRIPLPEAGKEGTSYAAAMSQVLGAIIDDLCAEIEAAGR